MADSSVEHREPARYGADDDTASPDTAQGARTTATHHARPSRTVWRALVPAVFALAGLLFYTSAATSNGTDISHDNDVQLSDLISQQSQRNAQAEQQIQNLNNQIDALARQAGPAASSGPQQLADQLSGPAGLTPVTGAGVTVTLDDAPVGATARPGYPPPQPDWLVVHQQDVRAVMNALWTGGATAMEVMDQRVTTTDAIRCVGNTLILGGRVYSPPYTITAIGDPTALIRALNADPYIQIYQGYVTAYGLGYTVTPRDSVTVPAYSGPLSLPYAKVVGS